MENSTENFNIKNKEQIFFKNYRTIHCHFGGYGFREENFIQDLEINYQKKSIEIGGENYELYSNIKNS